jgi:signal transduction histidine kinase
VCDDPGVAGRTARSRAAHHVLLPLLGACVIASAELYLAFGFGDRPVSKYITDVTFGLGWVVGGVVASWLRPDSRIGPLMTLLGVVVFLNNPWGFGLPTSFPMRGVITVLGVVGFWTVAAIGGHLLLGYPTGRLRTTGERRLVQVGYVSAAVFSAATLLVLTPPGGSCGTRCPISPMRLVADAELSQVVFVTANVWFAGLAAVLTVLLIRRVASASPRHRRRERVPLVAAGFVVSAVTLWFAGRAAFPTDWEVTDWLLYPAMYLSLLAVPAALMVGLLRDRLSRAAVAEMMVELEVVGPDSLESTMQSVLDDPGLRVGFPFGDSGDLVDTEGRDLVVPRGAATTRLGDDDTPVAVLIHDPDLDEHPELMRAAGAAARLALENARLQAEVRAQLAEVQASRQRIVAATDSERKRLERNLHDGAQQRLLGVGVALQMLRSRLAEREADNEALQAAEHELKSALRELRDLAQGLHPAVLSDQGLTAAVGMLVRRLDVPARIEDRLDQRLPAPVETTAYYVISEALQNVVKHARASNVEIRLERVGNEAVVSVVDDGIGLPHPATGSGLRGLADRAAAANGTLTLSSPSGRGTSVALRVPCG